MVVVQLYTLTAYLATAIVPYLWHPRPSPPTWMLIVPGWLLGVPGHYITLLGPVPGVVLGIAGVVALVRVRRSCPARLYRWCIAGTALTVAYGLFAFTPLAYEIALFIAD
ncbi:hypothetical protein JOF56_010136 [Kibdelosporangium banguiense]|uniref:Sensor histidine kinase n=1 Tax=Kibdelosporangium banguiense TaxID=1365924 RepID=A0ABS4TZE9_9PSEU|nr:hypothetical protein [Kibdelosporangium banguiense]MBP2329751.1 hypothetical protein [Kibdelosporangium banguiense]